MSAAGDSWDRRGWRRVAMVFACMLLVAAAREAPAQRGAPPARRYRNAEYQFAVRLPRALHVETSTPPFPDHGFTARLAPAATLNVYAGYATSDEATLAAEAAQSRRSRREGGCTETGRKTTTLRGVPATELTFRCPPRSAGGRWSVEHILMAVRRPPGRSTILYQVEVEYTQGSRGAADAERVFRSVVDGLSFTSGNTSAASRP